MKNVCKGRIDAVQLRGYTWESSIMWKNIPIKRQVVEIFVRKKGKIEKIMKNEDLPTGSGIRKFL